MMGLVKVKKILEQRIRTKKKEISSLTKIAVEAHDAASVKAAIAIKLILEDELSTLKHILNVAKQ